MRGQIECGDFRFAHHVGERRRDDRPHQLGDFVRFEFAVGADEFREQRPRVAGLERVRAECAEADRPEIGVAEHDGVGRAPLQIGDLPRADEIHFRLERAVESVLPALQGGKDRQVVGFSS